MKDEDTFFVVLWRRVGIESVPLKEKRMERCIHLSSGTRLTLKMRLAGKAR
jgi:hypothetical protein